MLEEEKFIRNKIEECTRIIEASSYIGNKKAYAKERTQLKCILNLIQKQQEKIEKLNDKNRDLLRKLRNRVKEVSKLTKYSMYKKEFSTLNKRLEKKDKIIDLMAENIVIQNTAINEEYAVDENMMNKQYVKQYYKKKVEDKQC